LIPQRKTEIKAEAPGSVAAEKITGDVHTHTYTYNFVGSPPSAPPATVDLTADALFEGLIESWGLADRVREAEEFENRGKPEEAAALYESVAVQLEAGSQAPIAYEYRRRQAKALFATPHGAQAAQILLKVSWRTLLQDFAPDGTRRLWNGIPSEHIDGLPHEVQAALAALDTAASAPYKERDSSDALLGQLAALGPDAMFVEEFAVFAAEWALSANTERPDTAALSVLEQVAARWRGTDPDLRLRLEMCLAEFRSDWGRVEILVGGESRLKGWAQARRARSCAYVTPKESTVYYEVAFSEALNLSMGGEARNWNASKWKALWWSGLFSTDQLVQQQQMLQSLPPTEPELVVPGGAVRMKDDPRQSELGQQDHVLEPLVREQSERSSSRRAAEQNAGQELSRRSLENVQTWLWASVVAGFLGSELEAIRQLGKILEERKQLIRALECYCRADAKKDAELLAKSLPEAVVQFPTNSRLMTAPHARAIGLVVAAACADLLEDRDATDWYEVALRTVCARGTRQPGNAVYYAITAMAKLVNTSTEPLATSTLDELASIVSGDTTPNDARSWAKILLGIARSHEEHFERAMRLVYTLVPRDEDFGSVVLAVGRDLLPKSRDLAIEMLSECATDAPEQVALILIEAGVDAGERGVARAAQYMQQLRDWTPGDGTVTTWGNDRWKLSIYAAVLSEGDRLQAAQILLTQAESHFETASDRRSILRVLASLAYHIPDEAVRAEYFQRLISIAQGSFEGSADDRLSELFGDPSGSFFFSGGFPSIRGAGLKAAAAFATSPADFTNLLKTAVKILKSEPDRAELMDVAVSLTRVPDGILIEQFASYMAADFRPEIRTAAALILLHSDPPPEEELKQLATDDSDLVRRSLADAVGRSDSNSSLVQELREIFCNDPRRSVRHALGKP
jgi:hypothetical protein